MRSLRTCDINQEPNVNLERMSSFEQFCGGPIWDVNATWNTNDPDFTNCFHKTALSWTPCFLLFIIVPFEVSKYVKSVNRNIPWNLFNLAKLIVTLALVVISIVELVLLFVKTPVVYTVDYVTSSIFIVTYLCSLVMLLLSMRFGIHTSPAQFLFYFLHTITGGITLRSLIKRQYEVEEYGDDPGTIDRLCITFGIQYSCVILLLILNLFSDTKPLVYDEDLAALTKPCPQIRASYFSKLVYSWTNRKYTILIQLFDNGVQCGSPPVHMRSLRTCDINQEPNVNLERMSSFEQFCGGPIWDVNATWNTNDPDFTNCFHKTALSWTPCFLLFIIVPFEVSKYVKSVNRNIPWNLFNLAKLIVTLALVVISIVELVLLFVKTPVVYTVDYVTSSIFIGKKFSVYPALFYTFGPSFLWGTAIKTVNDVLAMAAPQIMSLMIAYVSALTPEPPWKGYFYAAALLIVTVLQSVLLSQSNEMMFVLGMNLRTALISVIYRKSLRLSGAAKKESTVGEIVNLMSVDVQRFMDLMPYLNMLWSAPLQIALCCYFIYQELGAAMFAGLAVMVIGIPFNVVVASFSRKYQLEQMKNKDDRVKLMNEILGGVKVLKLYGWERSFMGQILDIRDREIVVLKKAAWVGAMINFVWISVPFFVALASFATYIFIDSGQVLDPSKAFVTLTYLNILQRPMSVLPLLIIGLVQVFVSLDRINKFVNNEELNQDSVQHDKSQKDHPVSVQNGTFAWGKSEPTVLRNINIKIPRGTLTAVVGTVGSGKSSLISALLGEMEKEEGTIMSLMIAFVSTEESKFAWKGYFYGTVLLIVTMFQSIILSQYFEKMFVVGMNLRTALISVIYRKSLRLSGAAKKESTVGEIVNLMSVDVQRFMDLLPYLNMSAPLQIALSCYFIYQELGVAMFSGLAVMIIAIPFNAVVVSFSRKYQLEQMKNKDDRVKLMNEILGGVKVLKLYGWEQSFMGQILDIRDREIVVLKKSAWLGAMINFVWISVPFLVALASFATYIFMDGGQVLDPSKAFVTLTYLNIMRMPMSVLPFMIIGLVQVGVSLDRINKFMNNEELDSNAVQHDESQKDHPVSVQNGTFAWGKSEPTVLRNINIKIPKGTLTAVVGTVGSGKSSLISALLGEMEKEEGTVNMVGSVAYVPQQAWMQNATLKNNILFGKELNGKKYAHIVDSCALKSDIQILPGGDTTEIGEKGINLSGGQKQRVSLARAC
eukprot:TCALIF_02191-PA protein Name:"Similar to ABCC1 Multidrug resistance-associated protein 1 (Gallus gallus)" AED:0.28 eAED:0.28 QI:0/0.14/0/0.75/0.28/0.25/8/0/1220